MGKRVTKDNFVRSQFTFYRSFWDTAQLIREPEQRCQAYDVLCSYAITNRRPNMEELSNIVQMYFLAHQVILDKGREKAWNSYDAEEQTENKPKTNEKQTRYKRKTNQNQTENKPKTNQLLDIEKERDINNNKTEKEMSLEETSHASAFEIFWDAYPKHVDRARAEKAFARVDAPLKELLEGIEHHKAYNPGWQKNGGQYIPHGANWLEDARWKDRFDDIPVRDPNGKASCRYGESEKAAALLTLSE